MGITTTPSWVAFGAQPNSEVVVGQHAREHDRSVFDAKRYIGRPFSDPKVAEFNNNVPFSVVAGARDRCEVNLGENWNVAVEEVSAKVLTQMKKIAEAHCGREVKNCVITVPANFNQLQRAATAQACHIAGLKACRIINEPTAAALACKFHERDNLITALVFDLGGGTFDVSVVTCSEGSVEVNSTHGDMLLGGRDLDQLLVEYCIEQFRETTEIDLSNDQF